MRILVCGGRDYPHKERVWSELNALDTPPTVIIQGGALGADLAAVTWAVYANVRLEEFTADWAANSRAAGPIRNQAMIDIGKPDLVIAFPGGRGTADIVCRAKTAGIEVREIT